MEVWCGVCVATLCGASVYGVDVNASYISKKQSVVFFII